jgi:hypothetical protein
MHLRLHAGVMKRFSFSSSAFAFAQRLVSLFRQEALTPELGA